MLIGNSLGSLFRHYRTEHLHDFPMTAPSVATAEQHLWAAHDKEEEQAKSYKAENEIVAANYSERKARLISKAKIPSESILQAMWWFWIGAERQTAQNGHLFVGNAQASVTALLAATDVEALSEDLIDSVYLDLEYHLGYVPVNAEWEAAINEARDRDQERSREAQELEDDETGGSVLNDPVVRDTLMAVMERCNDEITSNEYDHLSNLLHEFTAPE